MKDQLFRHTAQLFYTEVFTINFIHRVDRFSALTLFSFHYTYLFSTTPQTQQAFHEGLFG